MNRTLLVVLVSAISVEVTVSSCGTPPSRCNSTTCSTGCCDLSGICQTGTSSGACGSRGNTCTACSLGAACSFGTCLGSSGAGSSGSGGGTTATGGGTTGTGGGTSGTGGGTSGTGGGISGTGGGISGTGGGVSGTGGGVSGTGGGVSGTGGGVSGTGGGVSGTGGGTSGGTVSATCDVVNAPACPAGTQCVINGAGSTAGTCKSGDCDLVEQNCLGQNQCVITVTADGGVRRICVPSGSSSLPPGASCTANGHCQPGSQCVSANGQDICRQFCNFTSNTCVSGTLCNSLVQLGGIAGEIHPVCAAQMTCDPLTQVPCPSTEACALFAAGSPPGCLPAGSVGVGGTCSNSMPCQRGLQCIGTGGTTGVCRAFCSTTGTPACTTGTCQPAGSGTLGTCQ